MKHEVLGVSRIWKAEFDDFRLKNLSERELLFRARSYLYDYAVFLPKADRHYLKPLEELAKTK